MPTIAYECSACGEKVQHDPNRGHVPPGWAFRKIREGLVITLCASDNIGFRAGEGLSPWLRNQLRARGVDV